VEGYAEHVVVKCMEGYAGDKWLSIHEELARNKILKCTKLTYFKN
jgi:hypothetical protein